MFTQLMALLIKGVTREMVKQPPNNAGFLATIAPVFLTRFYMQTINLKH